MNHASEVLARKGARSSRVSARVLEGPARKCPGMSSFIAMNDRLAQYGVKIAFTDHRDGSRVYELLDATGAERFISQDWPNLVSESNQLVNKIRENQK